MNQDIYIIRESDASQIAIWLRDRGGIALWESVDLSDPGFRLTTPRLSADGTPTPKPHWKVGSQPVRIILSPAEITVAVDEVVKRFHVGVRMGSNGFALKVTEGGTRRIRRAVAKAGEGAYHAFDYFTQEAIILRPKSVTPLLDWMSR